VSDQWTVRADTWAEDGWKEMAHMANDPNDDERMALRLPECFCQGQREPAKIAAVETIIIDIEANLRVP
jgi:hypothetical protein